ncbi:MAG: hypothetical protein OEX02_21760, partial [Cyclobacteriaceae bacterium]|nr:hypothetical protein [Cyclobacteriaceae bacterium]
ASLYYYSGIFGGETEVEKIFGMDALLEKLLTLIFLGCSNCKCALFYMKEINADNIISLMR